jgi:hypothetical protein
VTNIIIARQRFGKHVAAATNRRGIVHCKATISQNHVSVATNGYGNRRTVQGGGLFCSPRVIKENSFGVSRKRIQKLSVQLWSVNQWTLEAEEVTIPYSESRQSQWNGRHS